MGLASSPAVAGAVSNLVTQVITGLDFSVCMAGRVHFYFDRTWEPEGRIDLAGLDGYLGDGSDTLFALRV